MTTELHVLSDRRLASVTEWQRAIDAEGYPLRLAPDVEFGTIRGFLPAQLNGRKSGFECYHDDVAEVVNAARIRDFGRAWNFALGFRIVGDFAELRSAWMAATAYAHATEGIVYDSEDDRIYTHTEALEAVRNIERNWPTMQAAVQAAIKKIISRS